MLSHNYAIVLIQIKHGVFAAKFASKNTTQKPAIFGWLRQINEIILHCTATKEGQQVTVADVDRWHRQRGFKKIGYHYLVMLDGTIAPGRDESEIGAHCLGHNRNSIGVCYVGGLDSQLRPKDTRTDQQRQSLTGLIARLKKRYPGASVHGHREFANKACPCFDARKEYSDGVA